MSDKESACQCRRHRSLIPGSGRSPGVGNGNPPQYSCLESPMDRELGILNPWGCKGSDMTEHTHTRREYAVLKPSS